jgi:ketosteroid isomerase-like protein
MENKEVLIQANACVSRGDHEGFLSFCTDDVVWDFIGDQRLNGKQAIRDYMKLNYVEPPKFDVERLIDANDYITAIGKISLKDEAGKLVDYAYCDVWRFRDGRMAELQAFVIALQV